MEEDLLSPITADFGKRGMYQRNWAWGLLLYTMRHLHAVSCQAETHMRNSCSARVTIAYWRVA